MEHVFGKEQPKKFKKVAFDGTKTNMISVKISKVDSSGSLYAWHLMKQKQT